jgi:hypothetical protein
MNGLSTTERYRGQLIGTTQVVLANQQQQTAAARPEIQFEIEMLEASVAGLAADLGEMHSRLAPVLAWSSDNAAQGAAIAAAPAPGSPVGERLRVLGQRAAAMRSDITDLLAALAV